MFLTRRLVLGSGYVSNFILFYCSCICIQPFSPPDFTLFLQNGNVSKTTPKPYLTPGTSLFLCYNKIRDLGGTEVISVVDHPEHQNTIRSWIMPFVGFCDAVSVGIKVAYKMLWYFWMNALKFVHFCLTCGSS